MNMKDEATIKAMEQQLGIPCKYGPWWTARRLLQDCWKHKPAVIRDASFDLRELPFVDASRDILWRRELEEYMIGWHVHHFDKNSQYLSACSSTDNGIGDPVHVADGDDDTHITEGLPGIYRVVNVDSSQSQFGDYALPAIIEPDQEWVTNDVLLFARSHCYTFHIAEAWVFNDYARILGDRKDEHNWAKRIWTARQFFKPCRTVTEKLAYYEMKKIALVGVGSFATGKHIHEGIDLIHPNWWSDEKGKARVNMLANFKKYGPPVLVKTDGVWYVTRDANPRTAVPGILDRTNELGGYKHESSFKLTREVFEQAQGVTFNELATLFKKAGGEI